MTSGPATNQRIIDLCQAVIALPDGAEEFEPAIHELRTAIHKHLEKARLEIVKMAQLVAARDHTDAD